MGQLHRTMDQGIHEKEGKLRQACVNRDTTAIWKIISSTAEKAFADFFELQGVERKAMSGRGDFRKTKHTNLGDGGKGIDPKSESGILHRKAESYGVQARRLTHTSNRIKRITDRSTNETIRKTLVQQNIRTLFAFVQNIVEADDEEENAQIRLITTAAKDAAAIQATYARVIKWYKARHDLVRAQAVSAASKFRKLEMEHKTTGLKKMATAVSATPPRPLLHTKRDRVGPLGQAVGTITTDPCEVDEVAIRKWHGIYQGNVDDLQQAARIFVGKYKQFMYFATSEYRVDPIDAREFMKTCTHGSMTAAGLDNWEPGELALLSFETFVWITEVLNLIEEGCPWPIGMQHARAAYLVKNASRTDDPSHTVCCLFCRH